MTDGIEPSQSIVHARGYPRPVYPQQLFHLPQQLFVFFSGLTPQSDNTNRKLQLWVDALG